MLRQTGTLDRVSRKLTPSALYNVGLVEFVGHPHAGSANDG